MNAAAILKLLQQEDFRCALSHRHLTPETASMDHIVPICHGGPHKVQNVQVLHRDINRAKGTLTNDEFIALCREVSALAQRTQLTKEESK